MVGSLVVSDICALLVSVGISVAIKLLLRGEANTSAYLYLWPFLFVFVAFYAAVGLYSGAAFGTPEELRRVSFSSVALFPCLAVLTSSWRSAAGHVFTWTAGGAMLLSILLVPLFRSQSRHWLSKKSWWGYPAVVFTSGETGRLVLEKLMTEHTWGLKPVAVFDASGNTAGTAAEPLFTFSDLAEAADVARCCRHPYAVIAFSGEQPESVIDSIESFISPYFARILLVPDLCRWSSLLVRPKSLGDILSLEVVQQTALPDRRLPKRLLDVVGSVSAGLLFSPLFLLIAIAIKLESTGPVFFGHTRIGKDGRRFKAWKFRTMMTDGSEILAQHLASSPDAMEEWVRDHKLREDPRVTRTGRILRKLSLDELPQIWNVLRNEMSLVGPRPIVEAEITKYGKSFPLYLRVKGGVTGLWQVSGRNDISYAARVSLDTFYVRNWSVWLDLYILYRTIGTVLFRNGAY